MTSAQDMTNVETYRSLIDAINTGDRRTTSRAIEQVFDPQLRMHTPLPSRATGVDALKEIFAVLQRAFPDLRVTVEQLIVDVGTVVSRNRVTGTHRGEYLGHAPTGRSVAYDEIFIFRFEDGRIAEMWGVADALAQLRQLGLLNGQA